MSDGNEADFENTHVSHNKTYYKKDFSRGNAMTTRRRAARNQQPQSEESEKEGNDEGAMSAGELDEDDRKKEMRERQRKRD